MKGRMLRRGLLAGVLAIGIAAPAAALASGGGGQVWVNATCTKEQYKPAKVILACADGNTYLEHLKWSKWSTSSAFGSGTYAVNTCKPSCAAGHFDKYPSKVKLTKPKKCRSQKHEVFSHATLSTRRKHAKDFTKSWKLSCPI